MIEAINLNFMGAAPRDLHRRLSPEQGPLHPEARRFSPHKSFTGTFSSINPYGGRLLLRISP
jgi:hypothetical protein